MIDDISLEDVETFEERRLAKVRRKVSRVDSLKKFLFSTKLDEKKTKQTDQSVLACPRPVLGASVPGYRASCLEVHDRWLGVQQSVLREEPCFIGGGGLRCAHGCAGNCCCMPRWHP